jgi:hypothetical protein
LPSVVSRPRPAAARNRGGVERGDEPPERIVGIAYLLRQRRSAREQQDQNTTGRVSGFIA